MLSTMTLDALAKVTGGQQADRSSTSRDVGTPVDDGVRRMLRCPADKMVYDTTTGSNIGCRP